MVGPRRRTRTYNDAMANEAERRDRDGPYRYTEGRKTWTSDMPLTAIVYDRILERVRTDSPTVDLWLKVMRNPQGYRLRLTVLRPDELDTLKAVIDEAFDRARPICERNYARDLSDYESGGDAGMSLYRHIPRVIHVGDISEEVARRDLLSELRTIDPTDIDPKYGDEPNVE